jgi:membrane-bound ClpP family serine protease
MCATLTSLAISYITALVLTTPDPIFEQASNFLVKLVFAWMILLVIIGLCHTLRFFIWVVKYFLKRSKKNKSICSYSSIARQRVMN